MPKLYKAAKLAELSLGKVGAFSPNDPSADPFELERALYWMDMIVAELAGTKRCHWLIPVTVVRPLTALTATYSLATLLGADYPTDGVLFPVDAFLRDSAGGDRPVDIIRREQYDDIERKDSQGAPERIYIDRLNDQQNISIHPLPAVSGFSLGLVFQKYSPSVIAGSTVNGNLSHGFSSEWQKYLVIATAAEIGDGPVRKIPASDVDRFRAQAAASLENLMTYSNREKPSEPRRTAAWGEDYGDDYLHRDYGRYL